MAMTLAEELFVCGINDEGHPPSIPATLGAGIVAELVLAGKIQLDDHGLKLFDQTPTGDPVLDKVLSQLHQDFVAKMTPAAILLSLGMEVTPIVRQRVVDEGAVVTEKPRRRWLGLPGRELYRVTPRIGEPVRERLRAALAGESVDERTAALAAIAQARGMAPDATPVEPPAALAGVIGACRAVEQIQT
jgi:hypothetical protein